ncbi:hypothetical protein MesoLjLb_71040 [Mesorhizobium sp. L-8-3]|nr:hypothetical protein MesoLjLb_71040 [Mesorhizobium sp. L-8-3]
MKQMIDLYDPTGTNTKHLLLTLEKSEKQRAALDELLLRVTFCDKLKGRLR